MQTLRQFITAHRIGMTAELTDENPNMPDAMDGARHWRCVLRSRGRRMTVTFTMGPALEREPTVADVLDCLALDAAGYEPASGFGEWCREYGYDTDSRKAEAIYRTVGRQAASLKRLLGSGPYRALLWDTERE